MSSILANTITDEDDSLPTFTAVEVAKPVFKLFSTWESSVDMKPSYETLFSDLYTLVQKLTHEYLTKGEGEEKLLKFASFVRHVVQFRGRSIKDLSLLN